MPFFYLSVWAAKAGKQSLFDKVDEIAASIGNNVKVNFSQWS